MKDNYWNGFMACVLILSIFALGYFVGYIVTWRNASVVAGCPQGTIIVDVPDYVRDDNGQLQRYYCDEAIDR